MKKLFLCANKQRGQASAEVLIIMAVGIMLLAAFGYVLTNQLNMFYAQEQQRVGELAVNTLATEINDAYFIGPGTVKNVVIKLPESVDFNESFVQNRALVLNVGGTDIVSETQVDINGRWPNANGSYVFSITAFDNYVTLSVQNLSFVPSQVQEVLHSISSKDFNVVVFNGSSTAADYNIFLSFNMGGNASLTSLTPAQSNHILSGAQQKAGFRITCGAGSGGQVYNGNILFVSDYNMFIPVELTCLN